MLLSIQLVLASVLLVVALAGGAYVSRMTRRAEAEGFAQAKAAAARIGLAFEEESTENLQRRLAEVEPFRSGRGRAPRSLHVFRGRYRGLDVRCFNYLYRSSDGKPSRLRSHGVAVAFLPAASPELMIRPETLGRRVLDSLTGDDIDFESDEFSRRFRVQSKDRRFAYDAVHARMMEFLLTPGWTNWHVQGNVVCLWSPPDVVLEPGDVAPVLDRLARFVEFVPWNRWTRGAPSVPIAMAPVE